MAVDFDVAKIKILSLADHNEIKLKINLKLAPKPLNDDIISCITKSWKGRNKIDQKIFKNYKQTCPQYDAEGTAKKMKFSVKYLFSICEQIRRKLRNFSHLLKRSLRILAVWVQFNIVARVAGPQARTGAYCGLDSYLRPLLEARPESHRSLLQNCYDHNGLYRGTILKWLVVTHVGKKYQMKSQKCIQRLKPFETSKMELPAKTVNCWKQLIIFAKSFILYVWQGSEYIWELS